MNALTLLAQAAAPAVATEKIGGVYETVMTWVRSNGMTFVQNVAVAVLILIVGRIVGNALKGVIVRLFDARKVDPTLGRFLANIVSSIVMILVLIAALGQLGIPTTQFTALIAAAGIAIGAALSGNISNFASGFMIIFFRPIKKGDYIAVAGTEGVVEEVQIFHTIINTNDNRRTIIANSKITSDTLTNFSGNDERRVDLNIVVGPQNDVAKVRQVLLAAASSNPLVLKTPAPEALLKDINGKLNFELRAWCRQEKYWDVFFQVTEAAHLQLGKAGVEGPIPLSAVIVRKE